MLKLKHPSTFLFLLTLIVLLTVVYSSGLNTSMQNHGNIIISATNTLQIFNDNKTAQLTSIDWGTMKIGETKTIFLQLYIDTQMFIEQHSNNSNYLKLEVLYMSTSSGGSWRMWYNGTVANFADTWTRLQIRLMPLPTATAGNFSYTTYINQIL